VYFSSKISRRRVLLRNGASGLESTTATDASLAAGATGYAARTIAAAIRTAVANTDRRLIATPAAEEIQDSANHVANRLEIRQRGMILRDLRAEPDIAASLTRLATDRNDWSGFVQGSANGRRGRGDRLQCHELGRLEVHAKNSASHVATDLIGKTVASIPGDYRDDCTCSGRERAVRVGVVMDTITDMKFLGDMGGRGLDLERWQLRGRDHIAVLDIRGRRDGDRRNDGLNRNVFHVTPRAEAVVAVSFPMAGGEKRTRIQQCERRD
jgi:hypothetical protein